MQLAMWGLDNGYHNGLSPNQVWGVKDLVDNLSLKDPEAVYRRLTKDEGETILGPQDLRGSQPSEAASLLVERLHELMT
jgi:hypothetical protein